jgi:hypothetical protein
MSGKVRLTSTILAMTGLLALGPAAAAAAGPVQDPVPIGPNEFFSGLVNGSDGISSPAVIKTNCIGPVQLGQTGNPLPGQSVEVKLVQPPVSANNVGYTGSARAITAYLVWPYPAAVTNTELVATFTSYFVLEPIPVTLTVPCAGQGEMLFAPTPSSSTGRPATVRVTFLGQP